MKAQKIVTPTTAPKATTPATATKVTTPTTISKVGAKQNKKKKIFLLIIKINK
jgi:hypothetical protein